MDNNSWNARYYCQTSDGRDLFFVEVFYEEYMESPDFNSSLGYNVLQHEEIRKLALAFIEQHSDDTVCDNILTQLFEMIQVLPGIESYYFKPESLNKFGKYIPEYEL